MLKYLHDYKTNEMYDLASSFIKKSYTDFKDSVKAMSKGDEKNIGIKILDIVNKILNFRGTKTTRTWLKNTNPKPMPSRLPITLAQLNAGNNSEKLKNEIRQLLYSLYRSKKLTKNVYNNLINAI